MSLARLLAKGYKRAGKGKLRRPDGKVVSEARAVAAAKRGAGKSKVSRAGSKKTLGKKPSLSKMTDGQLGREIDRVGDIRPRTAASERRMANIELERAKRWRNKVEDLSRKRDALNEQIRRNKVKWGRSGQRGFIEGDAPKQRALERTIKDQQSRAAKIQMEIEKAHKQMDKFLGSAQAFGAKPKKGSYSLIRPPGQGQQTFPAFAKDGSVRRMTIPRS